MNDLLARKELASSFTTSKTVDDLLSKGRLFLHPQQRFAKNFLNPHTTATRLLLKYDTGTGKTNASLAIAFEFLKLFRNYPPEEAPLVQVIGFSKQVFHNELLHRPEFGFVTSRDIAEEKRLAYLAEVGAEKDKEILADYQAYLRRRLTGSFKFYGYKEFYNRLFQGPEVQSVQELEDGLAAGTIKVNQEILKSFQGSLVICDEIHNVYNSLELNNYGLALSYLFNHYDTRLRVVFLSATPINNSPTEIIDLINLLVPRSLLPGGAPVRKDDLFTDDRHLKPGALETLGRLTGGYISFIRNQDPKYFPVRIIKGVSLPLPSSFHKELGKKLPYLKFLRCPMSSFHEKTYQAAFSDHLPPDAQPLLDMVLPSPEGELGVFKTKDIKYLYSHSSQEWKDKNKIEYGSTPGGDIFQLPGLEKYSAKYARLVTCLHRNLKGDRGKALIVHQYVKAGVLTIREILLRNGFIEEGEPHANTLCSRCGISRAKHPPGKGSFSEGVNASRHPFQPARFLLIYGEMDASTKNKILNKFRGRENAEGYQYRILLGSKVMNESIDLNCVRQVYVVSVPHNIPTLIQILGRAVRNKSHILLPPSQRNCKVKILVHSLSKGSSGSLSYEEMRYVEKISDYLVIQKIERVLNSRAVDAPLYRSTIFPQGPTPPDLGTLYYPLDPLFGKVWQKACREGRLSSSSITTKTFDPFYMHEEVLNVIYIVKRLFVESPAWTYGDLWKAVRDPPLDVYFYTPLIAEESLVIALSFLTGFTPSAPQDFVASVFDTSSSIIYKEVPHRIFWKDPYYILLPLVDIPAQNSDLGIDIDLLKSTPLINPDSWYRADHLNPDKAVDITEGLRTSNISYTQLKYKFYSQFHNTEVNALPTSVEVYNLDFHTHLLEDTIRYVFNVYTGRSAFSELHYFYLKMLYFYDRLEMVLFAEGTRETALWSHYKDYISSEKAPKYNAFLMSSMDKSSGHFQVERLNEYIGKNPSPSKKIKHVRLEDMELHLELKGHKKVLASILPVGHFLSTDIEAHGFIRSTPRIYLPDKDEWEKSGNFSFETTDVENDIIVGYYEKMPHNMELKFKLRAPVQKIVKHDDSRFTERGTTCSTRKKEDLEVIATSLGLKIDDSSIKGACQLIKLELMKREMKARHHHRYHKTQPRVRWFYFHFESQPTI